MIKDLFAGTAAAPKRPTRLTIYNFHRKVAEGLLPEIKMWSEGDIGPDEQVLEDLREILEKEAPDADGYTLARAMERDGWYGVNSELVEILDGAFSIAHSVEEDAVKEWVTANEIKAPLVAGTMVKTKHGVGPIVSIMEDTAKYIVQTDRFLEKNPSQAGKASGIVVAFEDAELCPAEAAS